MHVSTSIQTEAGQERGLRSEPECSAFQRSADSPLPALARDLVEQAANIPPLIAADETLARLRFVFVFFTAPPQQRVAAHSQHAGGRQGSDRTQMDAERDGGGSAFVSPPSERNPLSFSFVPVQ